MAVDSNDLSPVLCTYVPTRREDEFDTMLSSGIWSWSHDDLRHLRPWAFSRVASGALLVVGHRGPDSHVRKGGWSDATMAKVILGITADSRRDPQGFHLAFAPFFYGVRLGGHHLGPSILEALRLSAHQYGRPIAPAETAPSLYALARLIEHYPHPPNTDRPAHAALVEMIRWRATSRPDRARADAGPSEAGHSEVTAADSALSVNIGRQEPHHE